VKIVWVSANKFGYELLKESIKKSSVDIKGIITLSSKSKTKMYDEIDNKKWYEFGLNVYEIDDINKEKGLFERLLPDVVFLCGWRQIIDKDILNIPKHGFISFHPTLLPEGRGPAPIINSILYGIKDSGLTMFYVSKKIDDGDIIGQEKFEIENNDHANDVYNKTIRAGRILIKKYLPLIVKNNAPRIPQDNKNATYFEKPFIKNNMIDLKNDSVDEIYKKIKALSKPYKGAYIIKDGKKLTIWRAELSEK